MVEELGRDFVTGGEGFFGATCHRIRGSWRDTKDYSGISKIAEVLRSRGGGAEHSTYVYDDRPCQ